MNAWRPAAALHRTVAAADLAANVRIRDLVENVDVPDLGGVLRLVTIEQRPELGEVMMLPLPGPKPCGHAPRFWHRARAPKPAGGANAPSTAAARWRRLRI